MIRRVSDYADLVVCTAVCNDVQPDEPISVDDLKLDSGTFLLHESGEGYAYVKRSSLPRSVFAMVRVRERSRGRGIGTELLAGAYEEARAFGLERVWGRVRPDDERSYAYLRRRGFAEFAREVMLVRALARDEGEVADGIVELRDEHRAGAYAVAVECTPDMAFDPPRQALSYEEWAEELCGPVAFVALDGDRVVGYAALEERKAMPGVLEHGLTAVVRSHRGRGIAQRLKRAQIAWAARNGYRELITWTQDGNEPMRAVNTKLGYVERSGSISLRRLLP
jgi:GNAT superfamily N-acetyltransferase